MSAGVRIAVAAAALLVAAWFAFGVRETHELSRATAIVSQAAPLSAAQRSEAASLLSSAGELNPDHTVDIDRAQLALREGRTGAALGITYHVTSAEPDNLEAWYWLAKATRNRPRLFLLSLLKIRQLEPPVR